MMWYHDSMAMLPAGLLVLLTLVAAAVALVVLAVRQGGARPVRPASGAEQLLAERYARGDIDEEEYRRRLEFLRKA